MYLSITEAGAYGWRWYVALWWKPRLLLGIEPHHSVTAEHVHAYEAFLGPLSVVCFFWRQAEGAG